MEPREAARSFRWLAFMRIVVVSLIAALAAVVLLTGWALEFSGVAVLETRAPDGSSRSTRVWFAEPEGELWLEAGTPESAWYLDVLRDPRVAFSATGRSGRYVAQRVEDPDAHDRIRSLLREKYGWRDWWIDLLFDASRSVAVRLAPASDTRRRQRPADSSRPPAGAPGGATSAQTASRRRCYRARWP